MTTCPRCGQPLRSPVAVCPRCGQRFAPSAQPQQPQVANGWDGSAPAWVRQAQPPQFPQAPQAPSTSYAPHRQQQSGQGIPGQFSQQAASQHQPNQPNQPNQPGARPGFSISELVSEEALPDWLRQASVESGQPTQRQPAPGTPGMPAYSPPPASPQAPQLPMPSYGAGVAPIPAQEPQFPRPDASAFPSLESAGSYQAPLVGGGLSASSLLDPNALPTWLGGQGDAATSNGMRGGEGMRAQSLVDETALPEWLRNEPASPQQQPVALPPPATPAWGGFGPSSSMAAPSPAAPPIAGAPVPLGLPPAYHANGMVPQQPPAIMGGQPGMSASQLVDPDALPEWMKADGGDGGNGRAAQPRGNGQSAAAPQGGWSASDLIDPSMLPGWVRGNEAAGSPAQMPQAPQMPQASAKRPALSAVPPQQGDPRERTDRVAAQRDFGASRVGTSQDAAISRKHPAQAANPLNDHEMPDWLRDEAANAPDSPSGRGQGAAAYAPDRQGRGGSRSWNGYDAQEDPYGDQRRQNGQNGQNRRNGQRGQNGQNGQSRRMPASQGGQAGQSWAAPDDRDNSPWSRQQPTRRQSKPAAKKRKGGFFGFFRRG